MSFGIYERISNYVVQCIGGCGRFLPAKGPAGRPQRRECGQFGCTKPWPSEEQQAGEGSE